MVELYWLPASCARVPLVALEELGIEFELRLVNKFKGDQDGPRYRRLNPSGKVPTLVWDGFVVPENLAIQKFLAAQAGDQPLLPTGTPVIEARTDSLLSWFASGIHPLIARLRHPETICSQPEALHSIRRIAADQLARSFAALNERLDGREWLFDGWSLADAYLQWLWYRATLSGFDGTGFARCADHSLRCQQRPSVERALARERLEIREREASGELPAGVLTAAKPVVALG